MLAAAENASGEPGEEPTDEVVEMSGRSWSSRSGQSWSATGRRRGAPRAFSRRDTPRHVHVHKHDRGLLSQIAVLGAYGAII